MEFTQQAVEQKASAPREGGWLPASPELLASLMGRDFVQRNGQEVRNYTTNSATYYFPAEALTYVLHRLENRPDLTDPQKAEYSDQLLGEIWNQGFMDMRADVHVGHLLGEIQVGGIAAEKSKAWRDLAHLTGAAEFVHSVQELGVRVGIRARDHLKSIVEILAESGLYSKQRRMVRLGSVAYAQAARENIARLNGKYRILGRLGYKAAGFVV